MAHIQWEQIIDINYQTNASPILLEENIINFPPSQKDEIIEALERIENTEAGQRIFASILAKQLSPDYANGRYQGERIGLAFPLQNTAGYLEHQDLANPILIINPDRTENLVFFTPDTNTAVKPRLDEIIMHELAHAGDPNIAEYNSLNLELRQLREKIGITIEDEGFIINQNTPFFQSLTQEQQSILLEASNLSLSGNLEQAAAHIESNKEVLSQHSVLERLFEATAREAYLNKAVEDYAIDIANIYQNETGSGYLRGAYDVGIYDLDNHDLPYGIISNYELTEDKRQEFEQLHQEWEQQFGAPETGITIIDDLLQRVFLPEERGEIPHHIRDVIPQDILNSFQQLEFSTEMQTIGQLSPLPAIVASSRTTDYSPGF